MKVQDVMKAVEKFVKSENKSEAKGIYRKNRELIKPIAVCPSSGDPKVGTGWSGGEIRAAGLTRKQMRSLHLRVDKFRKTLHEDNVEILKKIKSVSSVPS